MSNGGVSPGYTNAAGLGTAFWFLALELVHTFKYTYIHWIVILCWFSAFRRPSSVASSFTCPILLAGLPVQEIHDCFRTGEWEVGVRLFDLR